MPHFVACFDGFYNPPSSQDCVVGPTPDVTSEEEIVTSSMIIKLLIGANFNCYVSFALGNNVSVVFLWPFIKNLFNIKEHDNRTLKNSGKLQSTQMQWCANISSQCCSVLCFYIMFFYI